MYVCTCVTDTCACLYAQYGSLKLASGVPLDCSPPYILNLNPGLTVSVCLASQIVETPWLCLLHTGIADSESILSNHNLTGNTNFSYFFLIPHASSISRILFVVVCFSILVLFCLFGWYFYGLDARCHMIHGYSTARRFQPWRKLFYLLLYYTPHSISTQTP